MANPLLNLNLNLNVVADPVRDALPLLPRLWRLLVTHAGEMHMHAHHTCSMMARDLVQRASRHSWDACIIIRAARGREMHMGDAEMASPQVQHQR